MSSPIKEIQPVLERLRLQRLIPVACIAVLLVSTFRLYNIAYFWLDDFNNLFWVQRATLGQMLGHIINPVSRYFRPVGMLCYWLLLRASDLHSAPYHVVAWFFHAANTALVYVILKRLTKTCSGAAVGALLFATEAVYAQVYWDFGTIFELLAGFFSFVGLLFWISERRGWLQVIGASVALLLAMKGKEMAVTMPIAWVFYDLLLRRNLGRVIVIHWLLPCGLALWYGVSKAMAMKGVAPTDPYYMSINGSTFAAGFETYFNMLLGTSFPWQAWAGVVIVLILLCLLLRSRLGLFFLLWIFVTFLPVIFLINHRFAFYWYVPFFGASGFCAIAATNVYGAIERRTPSWVATSGAYSVFALLCFGAFILHRDTTRYARAWVGEKAAEYRAFVTGLKSLPPPSPGEIVYFDSKPSHFSPTHLRSAVQVALRRTDVDARFVSEFPSDARYRLRFHEGRLTQVSTGKDEQRENTP